MPSAIPVRHSAAANRFEAEADGRMAVTEYVTTDGARVFTHTFVPAEWRGRGVADALVRAALSDARARNLRVVARCSYVAEFIRRNPEFQPLVEE